VTAQRVWAVRLTPKGVEFHPAQVVRLTATRATVLFEGIKAVVSRDRMELGVARSERHGCTFAINREVAEVIAELAWHAHFGGRRAAALALLGLPGPAFTRGEVRAAFRMRIMAAHPDHGGDAEEFRALVRARDLLLA
jgi:hypothetical protein